MTQKQIDEYTKRYEAEHYLCWCGKRATHIAHRIAQSLTNYRVYGKEIIYVWECPVCDWINEERGKNIYTRIDLNCVGCGETIDLED
jgi:hypothetical protein